MCACVSSTQSIELGGTGGGSQFRCVSIFEPSKSPQSTSNRLPPASTRYFEPVTVPAAPRKVIFGIGLAFYGEPREKLGLFLDHGAHLRLSHCVQRTLTFSPHWLTLCPSFPRNEVP